MDLSIIKEKLKNYRFKDEKSSVLSYCFGQIDYLDENNENQKIGFNSVTFDNDNQEYTFILFKTNGTELTNTIEKKLTISENKLLDYTEFPLVIGKKR